MEGLTILVTYLCLAKSTKLRNISSVGGEHRLWSHVGVAGHLSHLLLEALNFLLEQLNCST
jgi:hypothetical protein